MLFVEPKVGKREKARARLDSELQSLLEIFKPSKLSRDIIENVWLASAKDFELSLSRLFGFTEENDQLKKQEVLAVAQAAEKAEKAAAALEKTRAAEGATKAKKKSKKKKKKGKGAAINTAIGSKCASAKGAAKGVVNGKKNSAKTDQNRSTANGSSAPASSKKEAKKIIGSETKKRRKSCKVGNSSPPHYLTPTKASSFRRAIPTKVARAIAEETIAKKNESLGVVDQQTKEAMGISILADVFPDVPLRVHQSIFKACKHNIDQTMERIIRMYEDGVVGDEDHADSDVPSGSESFGTKDALDLLNQAARNSTGEESGETSEDLNDLCEIFQDAHPYFVRGMLRAFNGDVNKVREELVANGFDPEKRRLVDSQKRNASVTMTYASLLKKGLKKSPKRRKSPHTKNFSSVDSFSGPLLGEDSADGFKIVRRKNARKKTKGEAFPRNDWVYARAMMLSKFQKASNEYRKGNTAYARILADEGEKFRFMALQYRGEEADKIFTENNPNVVLTKPALPHVYVNSQKGNNWTGVGEGTDNFQMIGNELPPMQIDLHGLHQQEALLRVSDMYKVCQDYVKSASHERGSGHVRVYQKLIIITGHGKYRGLVGQPRLLTTIRKYLKERRVKFQEAVGSITAIVDSKRIA
jgi:hypothetical protein